MPNIISQVISSSGVSVTSNTGSFAITFAEILTRYQGESGSPATRRAAVLTWLRQQLETTLGNVLVKSSNFDIDFLPGDGRINRFRINNG